jgi:outer membrane protein assembly factor BamB
LKLDGERICGCGLAMSYSCSLPVFVFWMTLCFAPGLRGDDWPQWRGPYRTGHAPAGAKVPAALPVEPKIVWRLKVGEGFASPVVAGGKVFYFDNQDGKETLHALNAADHQELWRAIVDDVFQDEQGPPGPRCTPLVNGDRVYAQSGKGELQCLRTDNGRRIWRVNFLKDFGAAFLGEDSKVPGAAEHGYTAAPVIDGDRLIACVGGTNGAGVVCFEKRTGKLLWKSQDDLAAYAAPMVGTLAGVKQAVCFTVSGLIGLALEEGQLLWRVPLKTSYGRNVSTPLLVDDWVVAGSYQAGLIGVRISADGAGLKAETVWTNKAAAMNFSSPIASGRHLYGLGPAKNLVCVEITTGQIAWSKEGYFKTAANVAHAAFLGFGKNILVCTDAGQLVLIAAEPAACRELGRAQVCGLNWCNPAYADGRLYVRDGIKATGNLFCVELLP